MDRNEDHQKAKKQSIILDQELADWIAAEAEKSYRKFSQQVNYLLRQMKQEIDSGNSDTGTKQDRA